MKRYLVTLATAGLVPLLAACGSTPPPSESAATDTPTAIVSTPTTSSPATPTSVSQATPSPTAVSQATESAPESAAAFPTPHPNPECVAAPIIRDPNIPPVTADEWSKGPDDAPITLIEYGDFQ